MVLGMGKWEGFERKVPPGVGIFVRACGGNGGDGGWGGGGQNGVNGRDGSNASEHNNAGVSASSR